jgi:hypothetical protein
MDCRKVEFGKMEKPGDFRFDDSFAWIYIWLPGSCSPDAVQIQRGAPGGQRIWGWDGNTDKPTLTPSILAPGQWHGWLLVGRLVSC